MQLVFEHTQPIGAGTNPACAHFATQTAQVFYISGGELYALTTYTPYGQWEDREFSLPFKAARDQNIEHMTLRNFPRYGLYGTWWSDDRHRFAIYEFEIIMSEYLEDATITSRMDEPITGLSMKVINEGTLFLGEDGGIMSPGARININFRAGNSTPIEMGTFYIDRNRIDTSSIDLQFSARNTIGKVLKDSTFDERNSFAAEELDKVLKKILEYAGIEQYRIQSTTTKRGMAFPSDMEILTGIQELLKTTSDWTIHELTDGTIVIGRPNYSLMPQPGRYTFNRNEDVFSRQITMDDSESYSRVCVRSEQTGDGTGKITATTLNVRPRPNTSEDPIGTLSKNTEIIVLSDTENGWLKIQAGDLEGYVSAKYVSWTKRASSKLEAYADVEYFETWGLAKHKTLYIDVPKDTSQEDLDDMAVQLASRVGMSGILETFSGPFRPQLQTGDEAEIISDDGRKLLGLITDITHHIGKGGFWTDFTVDSGGVRGKGRISDYIAKISGKQTSSNVTRLY